MNKTAVRHMDRNNDQAFVIYDRIVYVDTDEHGYALIHMDNGETVLTSNMVQDIRERVETVYHLRLRAGVD